jgi:ABC-2 type transport system ATP-binding protein
VKLLAAVVRDLAAAGVQLDNLGLRRSTLDDVFLALTGHVAEN